MRWKHNKCSKLCKGLRLVKWYNINIWRLIIIKSVQGKDIPQCYKVVKFKIIFYSFLLECNKVTEKYIKISKYE